MNIELLFEEFCQYAQVMKGQAPKTISRYRSLIPFFFKYTKVDSIGDLNEQMVYDFFMYGRTERNWSNNTFITYYMSLLGFFKWCCMKGHVTHNLVEHIELPRKEKRVPRKLTIQQSMQLLKVARNYPYKYHFLRYRDHAIFATYLYTGIRKSELLNLTLIDVDLKNLTLMVRQGKGRKDRIIPIGYQLAHILNKYLKERKRLRKSCPSFFTALRGNKGLSPGSLKYVTERLKNASGLDFSIHSLRHTFATLMLEGGCDIYSLSKMMGHSDIKTTTIYLSASAEHLRGELNKHPLNDMALYH
ncbi:MAG: tyrosine-type recombinase/integrase [Flavobacteriales bacterium]|nr:tyrosine-type recombinase/integrase [Flavobacteriales bacterium]